ncbi:Uncharacterised protein [uncultured archaeon]|nr:Uncharacterised protein [uncultured archaeon]
MTGLPIKIFKNLRITIILIVILFASIEAVESAVQANGGYITRNDFAVNSYTEHWLGFYGMITNNSITVNKGDYLIITTSPSPPDLSGLKAGNIIH